MVLLAAARDLPQDTMISIWTTTEDHQTTGDLLRRELRKNPHIWVQ